MSDFRKLDANLLSILNRFSNEINALVDFGLKMIEWDLQRPEKSDEHLPPILFLRNFIEKLDAVSILTRESSIDPSKVLLRTALENLVYLEYLLREDTERRSLCFLVWNTMKNKAWALKGDGKSNEYEDLRKKYGRDKYLKHSEPAILHNADQIIENGEELLSSEKYKLIRAEYDRAKKSIRDLNWYSMFHGPKSMYKLCEHLGMEVFYDILYRILSDSIHGNDILQGKLYTGNGRAEIVQIRFSKDAQSNTQHCFNFCLIAYSNYIKKRLPDRLPEFKQWFLSIRDFNLSLRNSNLFTFEQ